MRSNKGLGRHAARAKRLEQKQEELETPKSLSIYHVVLAHRFATKPDFRKGNNKVVVSDAEVRAAAKTKSGRPMTARNRRKVAAKLLAEKESV